MADRANAQSDPAAWIGDCLRRYGASAENQLRLESGPEPAWDEPLVGFSRGSDPLYQRFKEDIGPFLWTPVEIFTTTFPAVPVTPDELTVISWILPQTESSRRDNSRETTYPAKRWAHSRKEGEEFNEKLRDHVVTVLREAGYEAVAPIRSPLFQWEMSERYRYASSWSERHAAYAAGLGTFGLCDGLITPRGKAMRCGSVVARIKIPPTERPYDDHHAYCLFYHDGSCGKCIKRCPVNAITEQGHDKEKCRQYLREKMTGYCHSQYGLDTHACGLCQTGVPCEAKIPVPGRRTG